MLKVKNPVFIIGNYRGGTSLLFRLLSESDDLWSMYRESNDMWKIYHKNKDDHAETFLLTREDAMKNGGPEHLRSYFEKHYNRSTYNNYFLGYLSRVRKFRDGLIPFYNLMNYCNHLIKSLTMKEYRIIDKTPPNCFRVEFLATVFPDAKFIFLTRDPKTNTSSLMNAWRDKERFKFRFRKHINETMTLNIKNYGDDVWKFSMPPGWENYLDKSLAEVCAFQSISAYEHALNDLEKLGHEKYIQVKFEDLLANPEKTLKDVCKFVDVKFTDKMKKITDEMPLVNTASKPSKEKVDQNEEEIKEVMPQIRRMQEKLGY